MKVMEQELIEPRPGRLERMKRFLGMGTYHLMNMEGSNQLEQHLALAMHQHGTEAFTVLRSAEAPIQEYSRPD